MGEGLISAIFSQVLNTQYSHNATFMKSSALSRQEGSDGDLQDGIAQAEGEIISVVEMDGYEHVLFCPTTQPQNRPGDAHLNTDGTSK